MNQRNEIGGGYWLTQEQIDYVINNNASSNDFCFISDDEQHLSTCRSCLSFLAEQYTKRTIVVPFYTCSTVVDPFIEKGWKVIPYQIDRNLKIVWDKLIDIVLSESPSLILFHSYFGFQTINDNPECINWIKNRGIDIINDTTCSLLSTFSRIKSDYCVGSIRKWFPIPDGALLQGINIPSIESYNKDLEKAKLDAFVTKAKYLSGASIDKNDMLEKFTHATHLIDMASVPYTIAPTSRIFLSKENVDSVRVLRRNNYNRLYHHIDSIEGIFLPLKEADFNTVPYLLPIIVNDRSELQKYLAINGVYATILWTKPLQFMNIKDENSIYESILCFPINQCYGLSDMDRIGLLLNNYYNE